MSGYQIRKEQRQERHDDEPCPRCDHRMGGHRGVPGRCIHPDGCPCAVTFEDLRAWRAEGAIS